VIGRLAALKVLSAIMKDVAAPASGRDNNDRAAAGAVRSGLKRKTRQTRSEFLTLNLCRYNTRATWKCQLGC
jgi:hypothetical protein